MLVKEIQRIRGSLSLSTHTLPVVLLIFHSLLLGQGQTLPSKLHQEPANTLITTRNSATFWPCHTRRKTKIYLPNIIEIRRGSFFPSPSFLSMSCPLSLSFLYSLPPSPSLFFSFSKMNARLDIIYSSIYACIFLNFIMYAWFSYPTERITGGWEGEDSTGTTTGSWVAWWFSRLSIPLPILQWSFS